MSDLFWWYINKNYKSLNWLKRYMMKNIHWLLMKSLIIITCIWNVCLFKISSLSIVICSRYRPSHDDWACQKCDISRSCYCLWFLLLLERIVSSIGMFFFIFQCMYMYLWSVNEIDAWAALTSQQEYSLWHLQTNNHLLYLHRKS